MHQRLALAALIAVGAPVSALAQTAPARDNIDALIEVQCKAYKVPPAFVHRVVKRESNYNPRAKGGSALGLMQIKHATARGMGYKGDAGGLYDPETNLKYGVAYLAGAYRAAKGDLDQAYRYYSRGYYYAAKQLGITTEVADSAPPPAPAATTATGFAGLFGLRTTTPVQVASADPNAPLAYAAGAAQVQVQTVEVPLPPRRPAALSDAADALQVAAAPEPAAAVQSVAPQAQAAAQPALAETAGSVEVPLPPRRPSAVLLAAIKRPVAVARKTDFPEAVYQSAAAAPAQ